MICSSLPGMILNLPVSTCALPTTRMSSSAPHTSIPMHLGNACWCLRSNSRGPCLVKQFPSQPSPPHPTTVTGRAVHWMESGNIPWDSFPAHLAGVLMEIEQRSVGAGVSPLFGESCLFKGDFKATGYKPVRTISINARIGTAEGAWIESWGGGLKGNECALTLLPLARASGHLACWLLMTTLGPKARTGDPQWLVQLQTKLLVARRPSFFFFFDGRESQKSCELIS